MKSPISCTQQFSSRDPNTSKPTSQPTHPTHRQTTTHHSPNPSTQTQEMSWPSRPPSLGYSSHDSHASDDEDEGSDYITGFDRHFFSGDGIDYDDPARPHRRRPLSPGHEFPTPPPYSSRSSDWSAGIHPDLSEDDDDGYGGGDYRDRGFWQPLRNRMASGGFDDYGDGYDGDYDDDGRWSIGRLSGRWSRSPSRSPSSRRAPRREPSDDGYDSDGW